MQCFCKPALAVVLLLHTPQLWAKERLILRAGQSNMMGRGKTSELPAAYKTTPTNVKYFYHGRAQPLAKFAWFGPEVSFAHEVARAFPHDTFIYAQINLAHEQHAKSIAAVREQQAAVQQQLPRAFMVSSEGLGKQGDGIHYNAAGQIELGKRFARAYIQQMQ